MCLPLIRVLLSFVRVVLVGFLIFCGYPSAVNLLAMEHRHPSDGPDVDLRLVVDEGELQLTAIVNLAFCDEFLDLAREREEFLDPVEEKFYFEALEELIREKSELKIDGVVVDAPAAEVEALPVDDKVAWQFPNFGRLAITRLRCQFRFPIKQTPRSIRLAWQLYPDNLAIGDRKDVPPLDIKSEWLIFGESLLVDLTHVEPAHTWHGSGKRERVFRDVPGAVSREAGEIGLRPRTLFVAALVFFAALMAWFLRGPRRAVALSLACVAAAAGLFLVNQDRQEPAAGSRTLDDDSALEVFSALHANIYRAFDYTKESQVYDALARSIRGDHLDEIYDQVYRGLVLQEEGGAVSRVQKVEILSARRLAGDSDAAAAETKDAFTVEARWQVTGRVFHWGHAHRRTNEYRARYRVVAEDEAWRIAKSEVLEQRRIPREGDDPPPGTRDG